MPAPHELLAGVDGALPRWERFEVRRRLGAGSFGLVCEAFDKKRGEVVALKILHKVDPSLLYHFKGEFRALADVAHPNLVALHELLRIEESWALTMELVLGTDFIGYVRAPAPAVRQSRIIRRFTIPDESAPADAPAPLPHTTADLGRLRAALRQLASGVAALHAAGKLHRDLKPGNVLVDREGRVVVLDFGLAVELEGAAPDGGGGTMRPTVGGTVAYMPPEQADGRKLTEAADWYAVGIMIHEALTGKVPHDGSILQILSAKEAGDAPPPSRSVSGVPEDLDRLCAALTRKDPAARPPGAEILRALGADAPSRSDAGKVHAVRAGAGLCGREAELLALRQAFERTCVGVPVTLFVAGAAGSGKTALVKKFTDGLALRGEAVCLVGRCHERESVPFKTLDGLVDALTRYLRRLPRAEVDSLLPANAHAIARLFPVLERVEAIAQAQVGREAVDPVELRRRCVQALKALLARISDRRRLVLAIDDLQWGDVDGAELCLELMRPPGAPSALLICAYRTEDAEGSAALKAVLASEADPDAGELREVQVGPLSLEAAQDLALAHLAPDAPPDALESRRDAPGTGSQSGKFPALLGAPPARPVSLATPTPPPVGIKLAPGVIAPLAPTPAGGQPAIGGASITALFGAAPLAMPASQSGSASTTGETLPMPGATPAAPPRASPSQAEETAPTPAPGGPGWVAAKPPPGLFPPLPPSLGTATTPLPGALGGGGAARAPLADRTPAEIALALEIARESGGDPMLVIELARHVRERGVTGPTSGLGGNVSLEKMVRARIDALAPEARRLLEAVAVAGRPLERAIAARAAKVEPEKERALVTALRAQSLVRAQASRERDELEVYHNRVREAVVGSLAPEALADRHRALAFAIASSDRPDQRALTLHFLAAGEKELAARHAVAAAELAARALAFDRAASLYRIALDAGPADSPERRATQVRLAETLVAAGRGAEAGRLFLDSVPGAPPGEAIELRRRAAEQLLRSGHLDEGLVVVAEVLRAIGMSLPSKRRALLSFLWRRLLLRVRGLRFRERPAAQVPSEELLRIDVCSAMSAVLSTTDTIRGADFQTRNLLLSLRAGEPMRVATALAFESGYSGTAGRRTRTRTARVQAAARALAERLQDPRTSGTVTLGEGIAAYCEGKFALACERCEQALAILRERCTGVAWEMATAQLFVAWSMLYTGKLRALSERIWSIIREADARGDVYGAANLHSGLGHFPMLMADDPAGARRVVDEGLARWKHEGFHNQHAVSADWRGQIHLYTGDAASAWKVATDVWEPARKAYILEIQFFRIFLRYLRGRAAVALAAQQEAGASQGAAERARLLREADALVLAIEKERTGWGNALALLVRGGADAVRGDRAVAAERFRAAAKDLAAVNMEMHAAAARRRQGELTGGAQGALLSVSADAWMAAQGIRNPRRWSGMLAPIG